MERFGTMLERFERPENSPRSVKTKKKPENCPNRSAFQKRPRPPMELPPNKNHRRQTRTYSPIHKTTHQTMDEIQRFKTHLERLGYSQGTVRMLPDCLRAFLEFTPRTIHQKQQGDIMDFYQYLQERPNRTRAGGLSESYIHHHIYALRLFFAWQEEKGAIVENPISTLTFKTPSSPPREILTLAEVKRLYEVTENYKEKAVLGMFYGCGLRRAEGERLDLKDIHFRLDILYVRAGKGSRRRAVPLSEKVRYDLENYVLKERRTKGDQAAFMPNTLGNRTRGSSYNGLLKELLGRADITKAISLHCLRHSIATHLLEAGMGVEYVRDFLGHKHLESTQLYTRINQKRLWNWNDT